jgi:CRP-like cAMP-binding protein
MAIDIRKLKDEAAAHLKDGNVSEAIKSLKFLAKLDKREVSHCTKIAELYLRSASTANAVLWYETAAQKYAEQGHLPKAIAVAKMILGIDPEHEGTKAMIAKLYAEKDSTGSSPAPEPVKPQPVVSVAERQDVEEVLDLAAEHVLTQLPRVALFSDLQPDEFQRLIEHIELRHFSAGETVIVEGEPGDAFYVITSGAAVVTKEDFSGITVELAVLEEGAFFGEFAYLAGSRRTASVTAQGDLEVLQIGRKNMDQLIQEHPRVKKVLQQFYRDRVLKNLLAISPLFVVFGDAEKQKFISQFSYAEYPERAAIIQEGTNGDALYVIMSGSVAVTQKSATGPVHLATLREGEFFGEMSLLSKGKTMASVIAATPTSVFKLPHASFHELTRAHPQFLKVISSYAEDRREQNEALFGDATKRGARGLV